MQRKDYNRWFVFELCRDRFPFASYRLSMSANRIKFVYLATGLFVLVALVCFVAAYWPEDSLLDGHEVSIQCFRSDSFPALSQDICLIYHPSVDSRCYRSGVEGAGFTIDGLFFVYTRRNDPNLDMYLLERIPTNILLHFSAQIDDLIKSGNAVPATMAPINPRHFLLRLRLTNNGLSFFGVRDYGHLSKEGIMLVKQVERIIFETMPKARRMLASKSYMTNSSASLLTNSTPTAKAPPTPTPRPASSPPAPGRAALSPPTATPPTEP